MQEENLQSTERDTERPVNNGRKRENECAVHVQLNEYPLGDCSSMSASVCLRLCVTNRLFGSMYTKRVACRK